SGVSPIRRGSHGMPCEPRSVLLWPLLGNRWPMHGTGQATWPRPARHTHCTLTVMRQLLSITLALVLAAPLVAHGGQYRGPNSISPPGNAGSSGTSQNKTNGNTIPGNNTPGAPNAPGNAGAPTTGAGTSTRGGASSRPLGYAVGDDLGRWEFWWEF